MRISESRIRRIIREELVRELNEQGAVGAQTGQVGTATTRTAPAAVGGFQAAGQQAGAAVGAFAGQMKDTLGLMMGDSGADAQARVSKQSEAMVKALISYLPEDLRKQLGGDRKIIEAWMTVLNAKTAAMAAAGTMLWNFPRVVEAIKAMHGQGQLVGIINRMLTAKKGVPEIMGAIIDAIASRLRNM